LVDVDRALHEEDSGGGDDRRWFYEHVHLTLPGRIVVAGRIADALTAAGWVAAPRRASADESADVPRALAFAPADEARALSGIRDMYRWPLFAEQMHARERMADLDNRIQARQAEWAQWDVARLRSQWDEIRRRRPIDGWAAQLLGDHLLARGDAATALAASEAALDANPSLTHARANAARACLRLGRLDRAREHAEIGLQREPDDPELLAVRGETAFRDQRWSEAERDLAQAHRLRPKDLGVIIDLPGWPKRAARRAPPKPIIGRGWKSVRKARTCSTIWPCCGLRIRRDATKPSRWPAGPRQRIRNRPTCG
jgi:tetratricopeptide (TPR) repeat protein